MGAMNLNTRVAMNCLVHGEYQKFVTDKEKRCPKCLKDEIDQKEVDKYPNSEGEVRKIQSLAVSATVELIAVVAKCEEHGEISLQVPKFMRAFVKCPICIENNRHKDLLPKKRKCVSEAISECGIPVNHIGMKFSALDASKSEKQGRITDRLIQYVKDLCALGYSDGAKNILLSGNMGTGKTLYASILLQEIISRAFVDRIQDEHDVRLKGRLSAFFISEPALLNAITATWGRDSPEKMKDLVDRLSSKSILCIDDVGASISTHTHLLDLYANVIDERYKRKLPTIITTNLKYDDLKLAVGARSADRLMEKNRIIIANFDWAGYRGGEIGTQEIEMF